MKYNVPPLLPAHTMVCRPICQSVCQLTSNLTSLFSQTTEEGRAISWYEDFPDKFNFLKRIFKGMLIWMVTVLSIFG